MTARALLRKLKRVEALCDRPGNEAERKAAELARARILARLQAVKADEPEAYTGVLIDLIAVQGLGAESIQSEAGMRLPAAGEIIARLLAWKAGDRSRAEIQRWAARYVDKMLLPDLPHTDPASIPVEVLLQLSAMKRQPLLTTDVPALIRFLRAEQGPEEAWTQWFLWLAARFA